MCDAPGLHLRKASPIWRSPIPGASMAGMLKSPCVLLCQNWFVGKLTIYHLRIVPIMLKKNFLPQKSTCLLESYFDQNGISKNSNSAALSFSPMKWSGFNFKYPRSWTDSYHIVDLHYSNPFFLLLNTPQSPKTTQYCHFWEVSGWSIRIFINRV